MTEDYLEARARRGSRARFERVLAKVPDVEPEEDDRMEERLAAEGYRFYSQEASEFAAASARAFAEISDHCAQLGDQSPIPNP